MESKSATPLGGALVKRILAVLVFLLIWQWPAVAQTQQPLRVRCGGSSLTDSKGQVWQTDTGFTGGSPQTIETNISGTADPMLYEFFRWNPTSYSFPFQNGQYQVNLYFAEATPQAQVVGGRVFNVSLQGQTAFSNLDIFAAAGANAALIKSATATVTNGTMTIGFAHVSGLDPKVSAIEILPTSSSSTPTLNLQFKYPDGSAVSGTLNYVVSSSMVSFQGTKPLSNGQVQCQIFANPSSLGISAQFQVNLSLTDTAGHTLWQINLAMNPAQVNLGTVQSSALNVVVQKM
jgi:Malectin domain